MSAASQDLCPKAPTDFDTGENKFSLGDGERWTYVTGLSNNKKSRVFLWPLAERATQ
jgi:hypothetical protein